MSGSPTELDEADRYAEAALRLVKPGGRRLTVFRAEWLAHRIARQRDPLDPDRKRLDFLRKLYGRVKEHQGIDVIREFEEMALGSSEGESA